MALGSDPDCDVGTAINTAPARPLTVAYINDDGVDGYSATGDTLIAGIFDTTRDGVVSMGDELRIDQYPVDFDAIIRGTFTEQTRVIQGPTCCGNPPSVIEVSAGGSIYRFQSDPDVELYVETGVDENARRVHCVTISDGLGLGSTDDIVAETLVGSTCIPDTPVNLFRVDNVGIDHAFIDVDLNP